MNVGYHVKDQGCKTDRVYRQAPDSFIHVDKSLALDKASGAVAMSSAAIEEALGRSQDFCRCDTGCSL